MTAPVHILLSYQAPEPAANRLEKTSRPDTTNTMPLRQISPDLQTANDGEVSQGFQMDIIAVHGLNPRSKKPDDHAWGTWQTKSQRLWLRDDLPKHVPNSRIFLFQYNATVVYGSDQSTFIDKANDLLENIRVEREDADSRPILFLGHSMGGLLIKQALINAHVNSKYTSIKDATKGIAFFATPHHGGDWKLVSLGSLLGNLATAAGFQKGDKLVETLKSGSMFSDIMKDQWRHQLCKYDFVSFWGGSDNIVPRESSRMGMPGDLENVVRLDADHSTVCKFGEDERDQDNLKLVRSNIKDMYKKALNNNGLVQPQDLVDRLLIDMNGADRQKTLIILYLAAHNPFGEPLNAMIYAWLEEVGYFDHPRNVFPDIRSDSENAERFNAQTVYERINNVSSLLRKFAGGLLDIRMKRDATHNYFNYRIQFTRHDVLEYLKEEFPGRASADDSRFWASFLRVDRDIYCGLRAVEAHYAPLSSPPGEIGELFMHTFSWLLMSALEPEGHQPLIHCLEGFAEAAQNTPAFRRQLSIFPDKSERPHGNYWKCSFVHWAAYWGQSTYVRHALEQTKDGGQTVDSNGLNLLLTASISTDVSLTGFLLSKGRRFPDERVNIATSMGSASATVWMVVLRDFANNLNHHFQIARGSAPRVPYLNKNWMERWSGVLEAHLRAGADRTVFFQIRFGSQSYRVGLEDMLQALQPEDQHKIQALLGNIKPGVWMLWWEQMFSNRRDIKGDVLRLKQDAWVVECVRSQKTGEHLSEGFKVRVC